MPWLIGSDNLVTVDGVKDRQTGAAVTTATVTARLIAPDGTNVVAGVAMPYAGLDAEGGAIYAGSLPDTMELMADWSYEVEVTIDYGGVKLVIRQSGLAAYYRGES